MGFSCRTCGSTQVFHNCREVLQRPKALATEPVSTPCKPAIAVARPILQQPVHVTSPAAAPAKPVLTEPPTPPPDESEALAICEPQQSLVPIPRCERADCERHGIKQLWGFDFCKREAICKKRLKGNLLCLECYCELRDLIAEHIPAPPAKPGGYTLARTRKLKTVDKSAAVTIAWCRGDLLRAAKVFRGSAVRVPRQ
jgi:hypothetical protein